MDGYDIYMASPEYCFLCASRDYEREKLVEIGCNLCAIYVKDSNEAYLQRKRHPLTFRDALSKFLKETSQIKGRKKALAASRYVIDGSGSPMESKLATIACLPKSLGGYGLRRPKLNYEVVHNDEGRAFLKRESSSCDMVWIKEKIILEYDSDLSHFDRNQFVYDKKKYRALQMSGYQVYPIIRDDLRSLTKLDSLFFTLRKCLKMKKEEEKLNQYVEMRRKVYQNLFSKY
ncbi:MAG: hypothetical protein MJ092_05025 [Lachnospiraceae bacterium]|nr:hypothetical protein [Lachnospiraceae bacterium]